MTPDEMERVERLYAERNACVVAIVRLARNAGHRAGLRVDLEQPEWPVVSVELPTGQVSWHLPASLIADELPELEPHAQSWDGHDSAEKYRRLLAYHPPPIAPGSRRRPDR